MRYLIAIFTLTLSLLLTIPQSFAVSNATGAKFFYSTYNMDTTNWAPVIMSTTKSVKGLTILNTGASTLELGIYLASGASSGAVRQFIVPSTPATATFSPVTSYFPLSISQAYRIAVRPLQSAANGAGTLEINAFYN